MNRPGDWNCRSCSHLNFQRRESCQRCGDSRSSVGAGDFGGYAGISGGRAAAMSAALGFTTGSDVRPGDWYCTLGNCGTHNFASRSCCFKCGAFKDDSASAAAAAGIFDGDMMRSRLAGGGRSSWKSGDWICTRFGCNEHNFASRMECFRCSAPRDFTNRTSSY
ncbi:PREDICTED: uncharacterized RNA-binding protein C17H9.04c-like [Tarenaya hassleriana]|uniref:uncharacterized RNA-binding protein C17H9.04c-like n=1 Tax=Tarenaya hassleriana TaxID=28532 RepID=UPI00053C8E05|nr:PREDICTED: uncharacterized RNA-binding protein C17H9.04c-like [Tarenaya hassleriana]